MRQRPQPTPTKEGDGSSRRMKLVAPPRMHVETSGSWEITTDHVALNIEAIHQEVDLESGGPSQYVSYPKHDHSLREKKATTPLRLSEEKLAMLEKQQPYNNPYQPPASRFDWKPRLEDYHTVFRTPLHVPDSEYEMFLLGQTSRRKDTIVTKACCTSICVGFSAVGALFLLFIGLLLDTQPLYIAGTLPELVTQSTVTVNSNGDYITYSKPIIQYLVPGSLDERLPIAKTAYKAALSYFVTMLIALHVMDPSRFHFLAKFLARRSAYEDIPEASLPAFRRSNSSDSLLGTTTYNPSVWNRISGSLKSWLAIRGWYKPRPSRRHARKKTG